MSTDSKSQLSESANPEATELESKSQRKRDAHQITELAGQLVAMKPKALANLPLSVEISDAIKHCAEIRAHGARKRQLHFVSKLLRKSDNLAELQQHLANTGSVNTGQPGSSTHAEFRDKLLEDCSGMVQALRENYPNVELQQVRQLVRNAQAELKKAKDSTKDSATDSATNSAGGEGREMALNSTRAAKSLLKLLKSQ